MPNSLPVTADGSGGCDVVGVESRDRIGLDAIRLPRSVGSATTHRAHYLGEHKRPGGSDLSAQGLLLHMKGFHREELAEAVA